MNKIEFEDLLSKYIENDLSLADRKKIEAGVKIFDAILALHNLKNQI